MLTRNLQISLGEMIAYLPIPGGHIRLAERFVDPALSFAMGWNYWYNWVSRVSLHEGSRTDEISLSLCPLSLPPRPF